MLNIIVTKVVYACAGVCVCVYECARMDLYGSIVYGRMRSILKRLFNYPQIFILLHYCR